MFRRGAQAAWSDGKIRVSAVLCCIQPCSLISSCSAYLARVQSWVLQWASRPHLAPCGWAGTLFPHIRPHIKQTGCFELPSANLPRCPRYEEGEGLPRWHVPRPGGSDRFRGCCGRRWTKGWPFWGCVWHVTCSGGVEWWHPLFNEHDPMLEWACLPQRAVNLPAISAAPLIQEVLSNGSNKEG